MMSEEIEFVRRSGVIRKNVLHYINIIMQMN